jgi:fluoride exporter
MIVLGVACAGAIGAVCRYVVDVVVSERARTNLPVGTLVINVGGSLVLGVLTGFALYHGPASTPKIVLGTGFCGGFTTFSTFAWESIALIEARHYRVALTNVAASLVLPALAAAIGLAVTAW